MMRQLSLETVILTCRRWAWLLLLLAGISGSQLAAQEVPSGITAARESVVRVVVSLRDLPTRKLSSGTAFAIGPDTFVTNAHVIEIDLEQEIMSDQNRSQEDKVKTLEYWRSLGVRDFKALVFTIFDQNGVKHQVVEARRIGPQDLAILVTSGQSFKPLTINKSRLSRDENVWTLGYPGAAEVHNIEQPKEAQLGTGRVREYVQGTSDDGTINDLIQHSAAMSPGNSGGPLLDACGQVVGVNTIGNSQFLEGSGKWSIEADDLLNALRIYAPRIRAPTTDSCGSGGVHWNWALSGTVLLLAAGVAVLIRTRRKVPDGLAPSIGSSVRPAVAKNVELCTVVLEGIGLGRQFRIEASFDPAGNYLTVGRGSENHLVLDYPDVSRQHLKIGRISSGVAVTDLGSSNGTKIDGKKLDPHVSRAIPPGTAVEIGKTLVRIQLK